MVPPPPQESKGFVFKQGMEVGIEILITWTLTPVLVKQVHVQAFLVVQEKDNSGLDKEALISGEADLKEGREANWGLKEKASGQLSSGEFH